MVTFQLRIDKNSFPFRILIYRNGPTAKGCLDPDQGRHESIKRV